MLLLNWELESRRHDPDHGEWLVPELNGAAQHRRVRTELPLPQIGTQDDRIGATRSAGIVFFREETASERWSYSEQRKQFRGHYRSLQMQRLTRTDQSKVVRSENSHAVEDMIPCPPIQKIRIGCDIAVARGSDYGLNSHQAVSGRERQRLEHHGIYHAENRGCCAYPQRQSQNGGSCEAGISPEHPQAVAKVLKQVIHGNSHSDVPNVFLELFHSPKLAARLLQRLIAAHSGSCLLFRYEVKIGADFLVEILVHALLVKDVPAEVVEAAKWHGSFPMSLAKRSQWRARSVPTVLVLYRAGAGPIWLGGKTWHAGWCPPLPRRNLTSRPAPCGAGLETESQA